MQIIGLYIDKASPDVLKTLKIKEWYSFVKTTIDKSLFKQDNNEIIITNKLKETTIKNQGFINQLYQLNDSSDIKINLSCIVGKNGSGKSSLLYLVLRFFNNLGCLIKTKKPECNKDYVPKWASGFSGRLYFESSDNKGTYIFCIKIHDYKINDSFILDNYGYVNQNKTLPITLYKDGKEVKFNKTNIQEQLMDFIPYTIYTNYSLYSGYESFNPKFDWVETLYNKNDGYITPIVLVPYKKDGIININDENKLGKERLGYLSILMQSQNNDKPFLENYTPTIIEYSQNKDYKTISNQICSRLYSKWKYSIGEQYTSGKKEWPNETYESSFSETKHAIPEIRKIIQTTKTCWENYLKDYIKVYDYAHPEFLNYIAYKTIKIFLTYDQFKNIFYDGDLFYSYKTDKDDCNKLIKQQIQVLCPLIILKENPKDNDKYKIARNHVNIKIIQVLRFMKNLNTENSYLNNENNTTVSEFIEKSKIIFGEKLTYFDIEENYLPKFYNKEIKYIKNDEKQPVSLTEMSSGEQQLYFSLSYVIYHIKNLESITIDGEKDNKRLKYRNINLILDEAELYYHPEYQRMYIRNLLEVLSRSKFNKDEIRSINILIVTHSPYLISDIPSTNLLQLDEGQIQKCNEKTFCSNYYDLLKNQFFLKSSIGGIAQKYINSILETDRKIREINKESNGRYLTKEKTQEINRIVEEYKTYEDFYLEIINSIGDDYLSNSLNTIHKSILSSSETKIDKLNEIRQLLENASSEKIDQVLFNLKGNDNVEN